MIVLIDGVVAIIAAAVVCFWLSFALDYLPVLFGFGELSRSARIALLVISAALLLWQFYRLIARRFFVSMKNRSMALLVEKAHPKFDESMITTVDHCAHRGNAGRAEVQMDQAMMEITRDKAEILVPDIDLRKVVDFGFLLRGLGIAGLLLLTVGGFAIADGKNFKKAAQRLYLLDDAGWPRKVKLEIAGIRIRNEIAVEGIEELGKIIRPDARGTFRVPRGAAVTLLARAQESDPDASWRALPESCLMYFRSSEGASGTQVLNRIGRADAGWQNYQLVGSPLEGLLSTITFSLRGEDHRIGPYTIEVVDGPSVVQSSLDCAFPEYLSQPGVMSWTPRTIEWTGRAALPDGTRYTVRGGANKELEKVYVWDAGKSEMRFGEVNGNEFSFEADPLTDAETLQIYLVDKDSIVSDVPHAMKIEPIRDQAPDVITRLKGLGTAVTPQAMLPFEGQVTDDYLVKKAWVELEAPNRKLPPAEETIGAKGKLDALIDLDELGRAGLSLPEDDGSEISFVVKASDFFVLGDSEPNVGVGEKFTFELVSADKLVRLLERQEVAQRRRLEQIFGEVSNVRSYLTRTRSEGSSSSGNVTNAEPGDPDAMETELRRQALRIVFAQRSEIQMQKSRQEIGGVANAFDNLRLQQVNNRIDAEDRKQRLNDDVVVPLRKIPGGSIEELLTIVAELETVLKQIDKGVGGESAEENAGDLTERGLAQTDVVLAEIDAVLARLVKYETQNELLNLVRRLIKEQQDIQVKTRDKRQKDAFEGLLDE